MANLTTDKNLDKHLRIVKSGGENTSLELATEDNGARVKGDFEVTGKYETVYLKNTSHIRNDDDINLHAEGLDINFRAGGVAYLNWSAVSGLTMYSAIDTGDTVNFLPGANGNLTVSTQDDSDSDLAHIILDAEGKIILDSNSGIFVAKKAGTEFSAVNSAYAGMILGYTDIGLNEAHTAHNLTTSYTVPTDEFSVSFTAPPSGNVEIFMQIWFNAGSSGLGDLYAGLSTANATSGYAALQSYHEEQLVDQSGRFALEVISNLWTLTGLTAGTSYEYWIGFKSTSITGTPYIRWGGNSSNRTPDFIMKATALPATITT